jgi:hypothetical protein
MRAAVRPTCLPARALVETSALLLEFEYDLKKHIAAGDQGAIDALATNRTFATRAKKWVDKNPESQAINVLTLVDRLDKRVANGIRGHYDRMSESCQRAGIRHARHR